MKSSSHFAKQASLSYGRFARSRFVPAQSLRHRTAALALYRALLRSAEKVPIPGAAQPPKLPDHPVAQLVKKRFARNRPHDSSRLVFAAMTAGYKFLGLLAKAQAAGGAEHAEVMDYLDARQRASKASRDAHQYPARSPMWREPVPGRAPFVTRVNRPGEAPRFVADRTPTPKEWLTGERKPPRLAATTNGVPFIRFKKPQSYALSSFVGKNHKKYSRWTFNVIELEDDYVLAQYEDEWDLLMDTEIQKQTGQRSSDHPRPTETFSWSLQADRLFWEWKLDRFQEGMNARGEALLEYVKKEQDLARLERGETEPERDARQEPSADNQSAPRPGTQISARVDATINLNARLARQAEPDGPTPEEMSDPASSRAWRYIVKKQDKKLRKKLYETWYMTPMGRRLNQHYKP